MPTARKNHRICQEEPILQDGEKGVIIQRDKKTYAVAPHIPCGVVTPEQLRRIADVAEKYQAPALKLTSAARIAIVGLEESVIDDVWRDLGLDKGAATGLCVRSVKACPGTTFCKRGLQDSLSLGLELDKRYHARELPSKFKIGISGCPNQCAETCIKDLGLVGMPKGWRVLVGGNGGAMPRLAQELVRDLDRSQVLELIETIITFYAEHGKKHQRIGAFIEKYGWNEFQAAVLQQHEKSS